MGQITNLEFIDKILADNKRLLKIIENKDLEIRRLRGELQDTEDQKTILEMDWYQAQDADNAWIEEQLVHMEATGQTPAEHQFVATLESTQEPTFDEHKPDISELHDDIPF